MIWLSNIVALSVHIEGYSRNESLALSSISRFLIAYKCPDAIPWNQNNQYHDKAQDARNLGKKRSSINILKS